MSRREEFEEILSKLQEVKVYNLEYESDYLGELYKTYKEFFTPVAEGLSVDKHRWYELTTSVHKLLDWYVGVRGVTDLFSEAMDYSDVGIYLSFFEMEEVTVVSYKPVSSK